MARYYSTAQLSKNLSETPEGFLICQGVAITRAGDLDYAAGEITGTAMTVSRTINDIHNPVTIASFEGKPVTIGHPDDFIGPDNWKMLTVGIVQNVRPGTGDTADKLLADLLITDREAISAVKNSKLREVSCGYDYNFIEESDTRGRQENIIGNHVALVAAGRCGPVCAIVDHAPQLLLKPLQDKTVTMKNKIMSIFGKALDEAMPVEETTDADPVEETTDADPVEETTDVDPVVQSIEDRLTRIEDMLAKLMSTEETEAADEDPAAEVKTEVANDSATIARAEILAPGMSKTGDVKSKALKTAYATDSGKRIIDVLLAGRSFDSADTHTLFIAASEMVKSARRAKVDNARISVDSLPSIKSGVMTPEKINELNAARYGTK